MGDGVRRCVVYSEIVFPCQTKKGLMADKNNGKDNTTDKEDERQTEEVRRDDVLVIDMDSADITLFSGASKTRSKSRVISCGSKMVGSSKII